MAVSKEVLIRKLTTEEGYSRTLYKCIAGYWTGGPGINVEARSMPREVLRLWQDECPKLKVPTTTGIVQGLIMAEHGLPDSAWSLWFENIVDRLISEVANRLHDEYDISYGDLPHDAQIVVIDCSYQMGVSGFFEFKKTLAFIERGDYIDASLEILDSAYHNGKTVDGVHIPGTPERAKRNSELLRLCGCKL